MTRSDGMQIVRLRDTTPRSPPSGQGNLHDSYYVGPKNLAVIENEKFDVHLLYLPVGSSEPTFHWPPAAEQLGLPLSGRFFGWDPYGNEWLLEPFDAIYKREYPYAFRNAGREDVWLLSLKAPVKTPQPVWYHKESPPSIEEMKHKGMALIKKVVRFKDVIPISTSLGEKGNTPPIFSYLGKQKYSAVQSDLVDFSILYLPVGASESSFHYRPKCDVFLMPTNGRVLLSSKNDAVDLEPFDGVLLREHPYSLRNIGQEDVWMCSVFSPPTSREVYE